MAKFSYRAVEVGAGTDASFGVVEAASAKKARLAVSQILRARKQSGFAKPRARYTVTLEQRNSGAGGGGRGLTLRNMASVTIKRLPGGAVAVTGRKLNTARRKR